MEEEKKLEVVEPVEEIEVDEEVEINEEEIDGGDVNEVSD
jgi:hypothetical protein